MPNTNRYSKTITQDPTLPAAQAMLYGIGLTESDMNKAQVGIVSTGFEGNTCNMHLNDLAREVKAAVWDQDIVGLIFNTIGVSDGISNGTTGMRYSLVSRDLIADSIEAVCGAQFYDGLIAVVGCDKNMPGALIAMGRLNRPAIMVYGGTIAPGKWNGQDLNIVSAFEALGEKMSGKITPEDFKAIIQHACTGAGACGGMYTANTMAAAIEALGMSLPFSASNPAISPEKITECKLAAKTIRTLLEKDLKPRDIMTPEAFENALRVVIALGGSTNAVLHLIAMAKSVDLPLELNDFQRISDSTPVLGDLKPSGRFLMEDLHKVGGVPLVMKYLLQEGLLHGDCLTVTGNTIKENLAAVSLENFDTQKIIFPVSKPVKATGHLQILFGNLASEGAVAKISGKEGTHFQGIARVFNGEEELISGISSGRVAEGDVVVIRYAGPKGAPGMPEMLKPTSAIMGSGLGQHVALITDGRFSGGSHGFVVGHITPEAHEGGLLALVEDGDLIDINIETHEMNLLVSEEIIKQRKAAWIKPEPPVKKGLLFKYYQQVKSAAHGCVTDES